MNKYDLYNALDNDPDATDEPVDEEALAREAAINNAYAQRLERHFLSKVIIFLIGIALGVGANLALYYYFSKPKQEQMHVQLDLPQAMAAAIREAWGADANTPNSKKPGTINPLYTELRLSDADKKALQQMLPEFHFVFISSWEDLSPLIEQYKGDPLDVITTVVSDVELDSTSGTINVGLRSGKNMFASITYRLQRENLVWRVTSSVGDLKLL